MSLRITQLIVESRMGNRAALNALVPLIYDDLLVSARRQLRAERHNHTLDTAALVNEAYLRLSEQDRVAWQSRVHFLAAASVAMRRVLVNHANQRHRAKRGGGLAAITLQESHGAADQGDAVDLQELDRALKRLAEIDPRSSRVVECRYFGGLTIEETAEALDIAPATVKRDWLLAKTWLKRELS